MKEKILPIINVILALCAIGLTIGFNIYFSKYEYKSPGTALWIVLECGILLIDIIILFLDFTYAHGIAIFGPIAAIIIGLAYIIFDTTKVGTEYDNIYLFFIPHLVIYLAIFIIEVFYFTRYVKNKS